MRSHRPHFTWGPAGSKSLSPVYAAITYQYSADEAGRIPTYHKQFREWQTFRVPCIAFTFCRGSYAPRLSPQQVVPGCAMGT